MKYIIICIMSVLTLFIFTSNGNGIISDTMIIRNLDQIIKDIDRIDIKVDDINKKLDLIKSELVSSRENINASLSDHEVEIEKLKLSYENRKSSDRNSSLLWGALGSLGPLGVTFGGYRIVIGRRNGKNGNSKSA